MKVIVLSSVIILFFSILYCSKSINTSTSIPIVYNVDFGLLTDNDKIKKFKVSQTSQSLNSFKRELKLNLSFDLSLNSDDGYRPSVSSLHMSDRLVNIESLNYSRIIEITPIIKSTKNIKQKKGLIDISIEKSIVIKSHQWRENTILIKCGNIEQIISFEQKK